MVICLERGADLHMPSWCHCHSLSLASVKSRLVLPFCYRLTRLVPDKGPLNGRACVRACMYLCAACSFFCVVRQTWRINVFNFLRNSVFEKSLESVHCRPSGSRTNRRGRQFVTWRRAAYSVSVCCAAGTCQWWTPAKIASVTHDHRFTVLQPQLTYARVSRTDRLLQAVYSLLIIIIVFLYPR